MASPGHREAALSPAATKVTFDRDVSACAYLATARDDTLDLITADGDPLDANSVLVTSRVADTDVDGFGRFSLSVAC